MSWLNKILGGGADAGAELPRDWATALKKALADADKPHPGISARMFGYVATGEPVAVLHEVGKDSETAVALRLADAWRFHGQSVSHIAPVYAAIAGAPPASALRWAKLLVACVGSGHGSPDFDFPGTLRWPELLLYHASGKTYNSYDSSARPYPGLSMDLVERLLVEDGQPPGLLLTAAFASDVNKGYGRESGLQLVAAVSGYGAALERHVEAVRPLLSLPSVRQRLHMIALLGPATPATLAALAPELCLMAISSSKQVRAAAEPLVRRVPQAAFAQLREYAVSEKPEPRVLALRLIWDLGRITGAAEMQEFAQATAAADKAPNANALIQEWTAPAGAPGVAANVLPEYAVPVIEWANQLTPAAEQAIDSMFAAWNAEIDKNNQAARARLEVARTSGQKTWTHKDTERLSSADLGLVKRYIADPAPKTKARVQNNGYYVFHNSQSWQKFATTPGVSPVALTKLFVVMQGINERSQWSTDLGGWFSTNVNAMHAAQQRPSLLELALILEPMGYEPARVLASYCHTYSSLANDWNDAQVWPFFAHNIELLLQTMTAGANYWFDRKMLYKAIGTLPFPPDAVVNQLFDFALGTGKTDRPHAQAALNRLPGKEQRIVSALADGKSDTRANAATWLGKLGYKEAVPALEQALAKEKHDLAKGALLGALEALGQPLDKYLRRDLLLDEAKKAVAKGLPKDLEWFPWDALPAVQWADDGSSVAPEILRWFLVQAVKQKSPEPNAMLRQYCRRFEARGGENLGQFVLDAWLREDVRPIDAQDAMQRARSQAQSTHGYMKSHPQWYKDDPNLGKSVDELTALYLPGFLRQPAGSAAASKGLLAIAAACAGARAAASVGRYLKEYYGTRAAQGKALIAMLAWIDHPSATQLMLSIGNRFRTKSFQEEATRQAEQLAERKGWTLAELADRTIPAAGFDETGSMELDYGGRKFSARLVDDFKIELLNPEGKKIANLPEARQDDDEALVKDCKKALSAAKKEIKTIVQLQTDRLYEALCTERDWSYQDWELYLNQHAVMRRLIQRLVWARVEDGANGSVVSATFRPLDDGTLTDCEDNEVKLPEDARVRLAHDSVLPPQLVGQWVQHLTDYEIAPLFQQLGKGTYVLPADKAAAGEVKDFEGHLIEAYALRGRALKLGYTRGAAEDGGWFHVYEKRFPTLGLTATIEFTGNPLPETNRTVALLNLSFAGAAQEGGHWQRPQIKLAAVPKVLLSECYNDMRLIAAEGSGYDREWEKKSQY